MNLHSHTHYCVDTHIRISIHAPVYTHIHMNTQAVEVFTVFTAVDGRVV